jgi:hypothetical protein
VADMSRSKLEPVEITYRSRITEYMMEELKRKEIHMASTVPNRGIQDWANDGFEQRLLFKVKDTLNEQQEKHRHEMKGLQSMMHDLVKRVDHINGFYTWLMEVYPDTYVQYKALIDIQKLSIEETK